MQVDVLGFQVLLIQYNIFIYRFVLVFHFDEGIDYFAYFIMLR